METTANTVLITGGASGIGFAVAERFQQAGSKVIICGRREDKLRQAKEKHPEMDIRVCDVADENDRVSLYEWATKEFPQLNVLINNAGIQRRLKLTEKEAWNETQKEIERSLKNRKKNQIYIDHMQNARGKSVVAPYSVRPKAGATVSAPLEWKEVKGGKIRLQDFTIKTMLTRIKQKGDLFTEVLTNQQDIKNLL